MEEKHISSDHRHNHHHDHHKQQQAPSGIENHHAKEPHHAWVCHQCGWTYPNPHPSAKHRRNHKKHCGKIEGFPLIASGDRENQGGSSDEELTDDEHNPTDHQKPMPSEEKRIPPQTKTSAPTPDIDLDQFDQNGKDATKSILGDEVHGLNLSVTIEPSDDFEGPDWFSFEPKLNIFLKEAPDIDSSHIITGDTGTQEFPLKDSHTMSDYPEHIGIAGERQNISEEVKRSQVKSQDTGHAEQPRTFGMPATIPTNVTLEHNLEISSRKVGIASILEQASFKGENSDESKIKVPIAEKTLASVDQKNYELFQTSHQVSGNTIQDVSVCEHDMMHDVAYPSVFGKVSSAEKSPGHILRQKENPQSLAYEPETDSLTSEFTKTEELQRVDNIGITNPGITEHVMRFLDKQSRNGESTQRNIIMTDEDIDRNTKATVMALEKIPKTSLEDVVEQKSVVSEVLLSDARDNDLSFQGIDGAESRAQLSREESKHDSNGQSLEQSIVDERHQFKVVLDTSMAVRPATTVTVDNSLHLDASEHNHENALKFSTDDVWGEKSDSTENFEPALWEKLLEKDVKEAINQETSEQRGNAGTSPVNPFIHEYRLSKEVEPQTIEGRNVQTSEQLNNGSTEVERKHPSSTKGVEEDPLVSQPGWFPSFPEVTNESHVRKVDNELRTDAPEMILGAPELPRTDLRNSSPRSSNPNLEEEKKVRAKSIWSLCICCSGAS